ncbi:MAG: DUF5688 family protein [Anaerovoracaceae bacterium]
MNYESFKKEIQKQILDHLPEGKEGWTVKMEQIRKVNRLLDGMILMPPNYAQPPYGVGLTFYMEEYFELYRKGTPIEKILEEIARMTKEYVPSEQLTDSFFHPEKVKNQIIMELIHRQRNRKLLETLPHRDFLDLAVIYRILMKDEERGYYCSTVNYEMMKLLAMTEERLYQAAREYMPAELPFAARNFENKFMIISNLREMFGASVLLFPNVLDQVCEELGGNLYILPASGNKICVERENPKRLGEMQKMLRDFYHMSNDPDDMLSDQVYFYRWHSGQVEIMPDAADFKDEEGGRE